jgi:outer membrane receptor protein involved in Fe transport
VEVYAAEAQQLALVGRHSLIAGARIEFSEQKVADFVANSKGENARYLSQNYPISAQEVHVDAYSAALYVYDYITLMETLRAVGGVNYTYQEIPVNTGREPITSGREQQQQVSPKAGLIWSPISWFDLRGSYTRSLLGFGLNQSIRLEPTHVAGLVQTFRGAVPPSFVGDLDGADLETAEVVWDARFPETYLSVGWQRLSADKIRRSGLFLTQPGDTNFASRPSRSSIREQINFTEQSLEISAHRLVKKEWSFGTRYRLSYAELEQRYLDYNESLFVEPLERRSEFRAWLHTVELSALYRHSNGLFGELDGTWFSQETRKNGPDFAGDDFWQLNLKAGYRFPHQRAELTLGVLNVLGTDYNLDPLNAYPDLPRSRTFYVRLLLNF